MSATYTYGCQSVAENEGSERDRLILEHLPQVRLIARRIHERLPEHVNLDDLISAGIIGLIAAIDHFDPAHNVKLKTYAEHKIRGAILDSLRRLDWAPRQRRRKSKQIEAAIASAEQKLKRQPTEEEIARELEISLDTYYEWLVEVQGLNVGTLDYAGEQGDSQLLLNQISDDEEHTPARIVERSHLKALLAEGINRMPAMERTVLGMYYLQEMPLKEIARIVNLHESRISQYKSQAILRLRAHMQKLWPDRGTARNEQPTVN